MRDRFARYVAGAARLRRGAPASATCPSWSTSTAPPTATARRSRSASASSSRPTPACPGMIVRLRPLHRRHDPGHHHRPARHQRVHGRRPRRRPADHVAGVRGRLRRLRRRTSTCSTTRPRSSSRPGCALAQGNRLINYYLFAGGINPPLDEPVGDGNDRISFTGERHGTAAPVGPEGQRGLTYAADRATSSRRDGQRAAGWRGCTRSTTTSRSASCSTHYMTEYHHPASAVMTEIVEDLERAPRRRPAQGAGPLAAAGRLPVRRGGPAVRPAAEPPQVVALATGRLPRRRRAAAPRRPPAGRRRPAAARPGARARPRGPALHACWPTRSASARRAPSAADRGYFPLGRRAPGAPRLGPRPGVGWLQPLQVAARRRPLLIDVSTAAVLRGRGPVGAGRAIVSSPPSCPRDPEFFAGAADRLGVAPGLDLRADVPGLLATTTRDPRRRAAAAPAQRLRATRRSCTFTGSTAPSCSAAARLDVPARRGHWMLPLGLDVPGRPHRRADGRGRPGRRRRSLLPGAGSVDRRRRRPRCDCTARPGGRRAPPSCTTTATEWTPGRGDRRRLHLRS